MTRFAIIFMVATCSSFASLRSQSLNIRMLDSLNNLTPGQFDTYITSQGYKFFKSTRSQRYGEAATYVYRQNDSTLKANCFITKYIGTKSDRKKVISFQTTNVSGYLDLKKELEKEHFRESKTNADSVSLSITYSDVLSGRTIVLASYLSGGDKKTAIYEITLVAN
jgi:hypothetical protein